MALKKNDIAGGYAPVMPYLRVKGAAKAIEFYKKAFGAKERFRLAMGDKVAHAELDIQSCVVMLCDEFPEMGAVGPKTLKGTSITMALMVKSCDAATKKAVAAGGKCARGPTTEFYGDRSATIVDPFGHEWMLQEHVEDVPPKEMQRRLDQMMGAMAADPGKKPAKRKS